ncbi:MAG: hypothetical protein ACOVQK_03765, partial [Cyanobium sp.]
MGSLPTWREPRLVDGHLLWLESRPQDQGRTTLLMRPAGNTNAPARELTPSPWNLRSRLHGYGGGAFATDGTTVVFVHDGDRQLWRLDLSDGPLLVHTPDTGTQRLQAKVSAEALTPAQRSTLQDEVAAEAKANGQ